MSSSRVVAGKRAAKKFKQPQNLKKKPGTLHELKPLKRTMDSDCQTDQTTGRGKCYPRTAHEDPEREYRHSSTLSLTSTLDGVVWLRPRPDRFTPGKETRYPLYTKLGGPQGRSERVQKISPPPGFDPQTVQPVASRYIDWTIAAHN
jgi:hypothetical protein